MEPATDSVEVKVSPAIDVMLSDDIKDEKPTEILYHLELAFGVFNLTLTNPKYLMGVIR